MTIKRLTLEYSAQVESVLIREDETGEFCHWNDVEKIVAERDALKRLGTDLCTEASPWADVGSRIDCATNRECLRHAITEFLSVGYDGREPDENEYPLPIEVKS